jgi:hypothetical protein
MFPFVVGSAAHALAEQRCFAGVLSAKQVLPYRVMDMDMLCMDTVEMHGYK